MATARDDLRSMVSGLIETLPQGNARPDDWMDAARQVVRASLVGRQLHHDLEEVIPLRHRGLVLTGLEHLEARAGAYGSGDEAGTRKQLETMLRAIDAIQASDAGAWRSHRSGEEDPLLRIPSRKAFDDDIANAFKEASQTKPLSLLFVDIDNFKYINDSKGHQTGDRVLQGVASRLAEVAARRGKPYRYGGEELTLLMPNTTHEEALSAGISWRNQFIGDLWGVSIGLLIARIQFVASRNAVAEPIERESLTAVTRSLLAFEWVRTKTRAN